MQKNVPKINDLAKILFSEINQKTATTVTANIFAAIVYHGSVPTAENRYQLSTLCQKKGFYVDVGGGMAVVVVVVVGGGGVWWW